MSRFGFENEKKLLGARSGKYCGCGIISVLFWTKNRAQGTMCEQERYHGEKCNFSLFPKIRAFFAGNIPY